MALGTIAGGLLGAMGVRSAVTAIGTPGASASSRFLSFGKGFLPSGQFGIGYTGGAYAGYGITNTWDPFGIHKPKYKYYRQNIRMAYGMSGYGRYRGRYTRFRRYRRYGRYSRFSRYRRRPMYRRRSYY
jgi:hypothetical protein